MKNKHYKVLLAAPLLFLIEIIIFLPWLCGYFEVAYGDIIHKITDQRTDKSDIDFFRDSKHIYQNSEYTSRNEFKHLKYIDSVLEQAVGRKFKSGKILKRNNSLLVEHYFKYIKYFYYNGYCSEASEYMKKFSKLAKEDFQVIDVGFNNILDPEKDNYIIYRIERGMIFDYFDGRLNQARNNCPLTEEIKLLKSKDLSELSYHCNGMFIWDCVEAYFKFK